MRISSQRDAIGNNGNVHAARTAPQLPAEGTFPGDKAWAGVKSQRFQAAEVDGFTAGPRKRTNLIVQGSYQATPRLKVGVNRGESRPQDGADGDLLGNSTLTAGLYFGLTRRLTLTGELSRTQPRSVAADSARMNGVAAGTILFFWRGCVAMGRVVPRWRNPPSRRATNGAGPCRTVGSDP